jgi:hypothetical protein
VGVGQAHWRKLSAPPQPGYLTEVSKDAWVEVREPYWNNEVTWRGQVVMIVPANTKPVKAEVDPLFEVSRQARGLKQPTVPTNPSKNPRVVIKAKSGRCETFAMGGTTHYIYPMECPTCHSKGFAPSKKDRKQCEFCDGTEGGQNDQS